jgi:diacylglycerol kinase (ATP)
MKTQSSLDVPKHVRSASFDEIKLEAQRTVQQLMKHHSTTDENATATSMLLQVPAPTSQRSRSFDSAGSDDSGGAAAAAAAAFLDIPRRFQRRRSSGKGAVFCIHCQYVEEYRRQMSSEDTEGSSSQNYGSTDSRSSSFNDYSSEDESDEDEDEADDDANGASIDNDCSELFFHPTGNKLLAPTPIASPCGITFTLSPTNGDFLDFPTPGTPPMTSSPVFGPASPAIEVSMFPFSASGSSAGGSGEAADDDNSSSTSPYPAAACRQRRRSISRQEAIFVEPTGNSLENVSKVEETDDAETASSEHSKNKTEPDDSVVATETSSNHHQNHHHQNHHHQNNHQNHHVENDFVSDIYLAVPDLKRDRAASVDSCFSKLSSGAKTEELQLSDGGLTLTVPSGAVRSRSVDIVLPTEQQARYKALALAGPIGDRNGKGYVSID